MEGDNTRESEHGDNPEEFSVESLLREELDVTTRMIDNVLDALWPKGKSSVERKFRDERLEAADILDGRIHEYLVGRGNIVLVMNSYSILDQLQEQVVEERSKTVKEVDINAIVQERNEAFESINYHEDIGGEEDSLSRLVTDAIEVRRDLLDELTMLGQAMRSHDDPVTQRIKSLGEGIDVAVSTNDITPLRFVGLSLPNLITAIKNTDTAINNMPTRYDEWMVVKAKNNNLHQLLMQIKKMSNRF